MKNVWYNFKFEHKINSLCIEYHSATFVIMRLQIQFLNFHVHHPEIIDHNPHDYDHWPEIRFLDLNPQKNIEKNIEANLVFLSWWRIIDNTPSLTIQLNFKLPSLHTQTQIPCSFVPVHTTYYGYNRPVGYNAPGIS